MSLKHMCAQYPRDFECAPNSQQFRLHLPFSLFSSYYSSIVASLPVSFCCLFDLSLKSIILVSTYALGGLCPRRQPLQTYKARRGRLRGVSPPQRICKIAGHSWRTVSVVDLAFQTTQTLSFRARPLMYGLRPFVCLYAKSTQVCGQTLTCSWSPLLWSLPLLHSPSLLEGLTYPCGIRSSS